MYFYILKILRIMDNKGTLLLDAEKIKLSTRRIAFQILESNFSSSEVHLVGIEKNGVIFGQRIKKILEEIAPFKIHFSALTIDKKNPIAPITCSQDLHKMESMSMVVIDDVLNTGSTLMYAVKYLLDFPVKQLKTAVLVNRNHKKYPIKGDFKGISLSTSINEHIEVIFDSEKEGVYLS